MKKKSFIVIVILLVAIILGLCVFIAYDKNLFGIKGEKKESSNTVEKKDDTNKAKEIDINSDLIKNLVYPKSNSKMYSTMPNEYLLNEVYQQETYSNFVLKEENVNSFTLSTMVAASLEESNYNDNVIGCHYDENQKLIFDSSDSLNKSGCKKYDEEDLKNDIFRIFGPDTKYSPSNLEKTYCGYPMQYDAETKAYYAVMACGSAGAVLFKPILKTYKAELSNDYLYVYDYALLNYVESNPEDGLISLLFDTYDAYQNYENTKSTESAVASVTSEKEAQSKLEELINSGKANTYIWTFKKQSDGKYYYYSSKWQ